MMLLARQRVVFLAYPKAGSSSIEHALRPYKSCAAELYARAAHPVVHSDSPWKHMNVREFQTLFCLRRTGSGQRLRRVAAVRNPWDRMVSVWSYQRQHIPERHPLARSLDFGDYVRAGGSGSAFLTFTEFTRSLDGSFGVDIVLRVERLDDDFAQMCNRVGIDAVELPQLNASARPRYREMYDAETAEIVALAFADDITRFGYEF